ncbi:hypothetical protein L6R52_31815 [Myxococcota bacterium]|nr:hypothetical protein [Myxococcota bacterium]
MKLEADSRLTFPRELVFSTYRDRLPRLVPHLPNIKGITVLKREDAPGGAQGISKLVNKWEAKGEIPKPAQTVIKPEMLTWLDYATWDENAWTVEWRIETQMFTENIKCGGKNRYLPDGPNGSILEIRGHLDVDLKGIPGVPRLLAGTIAPVVEKFVIALLTPNLTSVAKGLEAFLQEEARRA